MKTFRSFYQKFLTACFALILFSLLSGGYALQAAGYDTKISLRNGTYQRFAGAGSMSGVLDLGATKERFPVWEIVGKSSIEEIPEYSAINRLEAFKAGNDHEAKLLVITCGSEDGDSFVDCSTAFAQKCDALGLKYIFMLSPGGHNWKYWPFHPNSPCHRFIMSTLFLREGGRYPCVPLK